MPDCFTTCTCFRSVTRKLAHYMVDVLEEHQDRVMENLLANGRKYKFK